MFAKFIIISIIGILALLSFLIANAHKFEDEVENDEFYSEEDLTMYENPEFYNPKTYHKK